MSVTPRLRALGVFLSNLPPPPPSEEAPVSRLNLRVWPTDVDLNIHLTNSRYAMMMDLGRLDLLMKARLGSALLLTDARPIAVEVRLKFQRELKVGQRFELETKAVGRDRRAIVIEQTFRVGEQVHAVGLVNLVLLRRGRVADPKLLASLLP